MQLRSHSALMAQGLNLQGQRAEAVPGKAAFQSLEVIRPKIMLALEGSRVNAMHASGEPRCSIT